MIFPFLLFAQLQRSNSPYLFPGYIEFPSIFTPTQKWAVTTGNRSLLGPFNNIKSYFFAAQWQPDSLRHSLGVVMNTEREGELIRWNRAHFQYSYTISLAEYWKWKLGAGLGFYNLVLEGTSSTGSLSVFALRNALSSAIQYKTHQLALVWQDIGNPSLYQGVKYTDYLQTMIETQVFSNPFKSLKLYHFSKWGEQQWTHDIGWKLEFNNKLGIGHITKFNRGNSFWVSGSLPVSETYTTNLQFIYNSPLFSKLPSDYQSIEIRLAFLAK